MVKRKFNKLTAVILACVVFLMSLIPAVSIYQSRSFGGTGYDHADGIMADAQAINQTYDYNSIQYLPKEYAYGTLFWTPESEVIVLNKDKIAYEMPDRTSKSRYFRWFFDLGGSLDAKITNCAVDKDGDLCDVFIEIDNIKGFNYQYAHNFTEGGRVYFTLAQDLEDFGNLIRFSFGTNWASAYFHMTYFKSGTLIPANVTHTVSMIYDFDVPAKAEQKLDNEIFGGSEGIAIKKGNVYYDKASSRAYLTDTTNNPYSYNVGVCAPPKSTCPVNSNDPVKETSMVVAAELMSSEYDMAYGGSGCGITWLFATPYTYEIDNPTKEVNKNVVYENEQFEYQISQYVPNNYYSGNFNFLNNVGGRYKVLYIEDQLNSNLAVNGDITIKNESGTDVTDKFDIVVDSNNKLTAVPKSEFRDSAEFYTHLFTVTVPVKANRGTGHTIGTISNVARTVATDNIQTFNLDSNTVNTGLQYDVNVYSEIDHGETWINNTDKDIQAEFTGTVKHNLSALSAVFFNVDKNYDLLRVLVDGEEISLDDLQITDDGDYAYLITDANVKSNISHEVIVQTEYKDTSVEVNYIDENGKVLATQEIIDGKVADDYSTVDKSIYGYELIAVPDNATGSMTRDTIVVNYVYRLKSATVITDFVDMQGNKLESSVITKGKVFDKYDTSSKDIKDYMLVKTPDNASGTMTEDTITVIYVYDRQNATVIAEYVDIQGNKLADSVSIQGKVGNDYETKAKAILGYKLTKTPNNATGTMKAGLTTVTYVYDLSGVLLPSAGSMTGAVYILFVGIIMLIIASIYVVCYEKQKLRSR